MNRTKRYEEPGHPYCVTTTTENRHLYFASPSLAQIAVANLHFYHERGDCELAAYVVMPDHLHALLSPTRASISDVMRRIKSYIAKQVNEAIDHSGPIWQPSFYDRIVRCEGHLQSYVDYIHWNPVKGRLVAEPGDYPFSSASALGVASGQG